MLVGLTSSVMLNSFRPIGDGTLEGPSNANAFRSKTEGFQDIGTSPDAPIHKDLHPPKYAYYSDTASGQDFDIMHLTILRNSRLI
jgi:hypothetical protein